MEAANWQATLRFIVFDGALLVGLFLLVTMGVLLIQQRSAGKKLGKGIREQRGLRGATLAAVGGAVTPFCSCSTVPLLNGMLKADFPLSVAFTFLVASPVINEGVILLLFLSAGVLAVAGYLVLAGALSITAGLLVQRFRLGRFVRDRGPIAGLPNAEADLSNRTPPSWRQSLELAWHGAWAELRNLGPWLAVGIGVGAIIYGWVPADWFARVGRSFPEWLMIPAASFLAAPLYVSPVAALPVGFALVEKGLDIGPVIAFLVAGAGISLPEMILLGHLFRWPLMLAHISTVVLSATALGYAATWLL